MSIAKATKPSTTATLLAPSRLRHQQQCCNIYNNQFRRTNSSTTSLKMHRRAWHSPPEMGISNQKSRNIPTYVTAYDPEDDNSVEFYFGADIARWWEPPQADPKGDSVSWSSLSEHEWLVLIISSAYNAKTKSDAVKVAGVIKREFDNLTKEEIIKYAKQVNQAKYEELKR